MTYSTDDSLTLDAERFLPDRIILEPDAVERAVTQSETVRPADQWQAYLNAIALMGFHHWLSERGIEIDMDNPACSVHQSGIASLFKGVCNLQMNGFNICLIPTGSLTDHIIAIPRAAVELAQWVPHLFVGIEVNDELHQVRVWGCLRHDHLQSRISDCATRPDWTYAVPLDWFDRNPDSILLYLRCLAPSALQRYAVAPPQVPPVESLQTILSALTPRIQTSMRPIWKLLTWEQAAGLLMQPDLLESWQSLISPAAISIANSSESMTQPVMNVGRWLQNQLDTIAEAWLWSLLPPLAQIRGESALRDTQSSIEQFEGVMASLNQYGVAIPAEARAAYRDLTWQNVAVRLYVVTWDSSEASPQPEWNLLLLLGAQPNRELPAGISLKVRDQMQLLDEQVLRATEPGAYLFSQVVGEWHEQFWVTIDLANGVTITLPPFTFSRE